MKHAMLIGAAALALGACNSANQIDEKNASVEDVAAKVREANDSGSFVRPGQWQSKVTIEQFDVPGMPPEAAQQMRNAVAQNRQNSFKSCLTREEAEQPKGKFFTGNEECRYDHFKMGSGKIDAAMQCPAGDGMTQVMTMQGTYTPNSYDLNMTMTSKGAEGPAGAMSMKMRVQSERIGECEAEIAAGTDAKKKG